MLTACSKTTVRGIMVDTERFGGDCTVFRRFCVRPGGQNTNESACSRVFFTVMIEESAISGRISGRSGVLMCKSRRPFYVQQSPLHGRNM